MQHFSPVKEFCTKTNIYLDFGFIFSNSLCRLALFTLCGAATWWLKRRQPVSAPLVASRLNGRRRATLSQNVQKTPQFIT
jgi:hypothetical protein